MTLSDIKSTSFNGFNFAYFDNGAVIFSKQTAAGYLKMRCLISDLTNKNLEFMARHNLTNTNKAPKKDRDLYR